MSRKTINFYIEDTNEKDMKLMEWLNSQTNRSAFIRIKLYEVMIGEGCNEPKSTFKYSTKEENLEVSDGFFSSMKGFGGI